MERRNASGCGTCVLRAAGSGSTAAAAVDLSDSLMIDQASFFALPLQKELENMFVVENGGFFNIT
jgi:hypothetical protein